VVDPSADALWEAVGFTATESGTIQHKPQTDVEWQGLRRQALTLTEAANLLMIEGQGWVGFFGQKGRRDKWKALRSFSRHDSLFAVNSCLDL
jgi:hypothetical protein